MFGKKGKAMANMIGTQVENFVEDALNKRAGEKGTKTEKPTERLGHINGKRRGLFIGINYHGQKGELRGCINDVKNIMEFLKSSGYEMDSDDIRVLTDDPSNQDHPELLPTRDNIIKGFKWLRQGCQSGDSLILHYSGHGGSIKDTDGDEEDGMDETLIPVDHTKAGIIVDDDVHDILCRGLPKGVRLTAIMDCCHSESMLDLPYTYSITGDLQIIENDLAEGISKIVGSGVKYLLSGNKKKAINDITQGVKMLLNGGSRKGKNKNKSAARQKTIETRTTQADCISFSGCKDSQTSADATIKGQATGAMSYALIKCLKGNTSGKITYTELLSKMRQTLDDGKFTQIPMMSAGRKLDLNSTFSF